MLISIFLFVDPTRIAVHDREVKVILSLKWADLTAAYFWLAATTGGRGLCARDDHTSDIHAFWYQIEPRVEKTARNWMF